MEISEMRGKDSRELQLDLHALQKESFTLKFKGASEQVATTARFRQIRRQCAQILTVLSERERGQAPPAPRARAAKKGKASS
jgi:large subunit ribosomal protein L29